MSPSSPRSASRPPVPLLARPPRTGGAGRAVVVCCDGTSNTLTGGDRDTHVLRLFEHLKAQGDGPLHLYYDPGVGAPDGMPGVDVMERLARRWEQVSGLAFGRGVFENIAEGYRELVRHAEEHDRIYLFGFSRGAFTARAISGMVHLFGLVDPQHEDLIPTLVRIYFASPDDGKARQLVTAYHAKQDAAMAPDAPKAALTVVGVGRPSTRVRDDVVAQVRRAFVTGWRREAWVHFVGVWDTVATVGLGPFSLRISSHATVRDKRIAHVRHALALDEHRTPFEPRLYSEDDFGSSAEDRSLAQRWFRGVHCDVGGSYPTAQAGLADDAFQWVLDEARACKLPCPPAARSGARVAHDPLREMALWAVTGMSIRDTCTARGTKASDRVPVHPTSHPSVLRGGPLRSVWDAGGRWKSYLGATFLTLGAWCATGAPLAQVGWRDAFDDLPRTVAAIADGNLRLATAQLRGLVDGGAALRDAGPLPPAAVRRALGFDLVLVAAYAWLLGLLVTRAFTRLAGLRTPGTPRPKWRFLGAALPLTVAADLAEDLLTLLTLGADCPFTRPICGVGMGLASGAKLLGLAGCAALVLYGYPRGWILPRDLAVHVDPDPVGPPPPATGSPGAGAGGAARSGSGPGPASPPSP